MIKIDVRVGMPTSRNVFLLISETLHCLLGHAFGERLELCLEEIADRMEWATSVALESLNYQPMAHCYVSRFGTEKFFKLARKAELCMLAVLLKRYAAHAQESEDQCLERMLNLGVRSEPGRRVYH